MFIIKDSQISFFAEEQKPNHPLNVKCRYSALNFSRNRLPDPVVAEMWASYWLRRTIFVLFLDLFVNSELK